MSIQKIATKLNCLAGSCIISGYKAKVIEVKVSQDSIGGFSTERRVNINGFAGGLEFNVEGGESEVNKLIGSIRPYSGSGQIEVGHTYIGLYSGKNAVAVFSSDHFIVSRYDDGSEYSCTTKQFSMHFRPAFDEGAFRNFCEDIDHYRGRVPDALIDACISEADKYK